MRLVPRQGSILATIVLTAGLTGCMSAYDFNSVEIAKTAMLGFDQQDVRMCAGFPTRTAEEGDISVWSYEGGGRTGGVNISAPVLFGAANTNLSLPGGSCRFQVRFLRGRVDRIAYSGDNDGPQGRNTVCTPVVRGCVDYARTFGRSPLPARVPPPAAAPGIASPALPSAGATTTPFSRKASPAEPAAMP